MSRRTTGTLKGIGIGLMLSAAVMGGCRMVHMMNDPKYRRKRCRLKKDAGRAMHIMGDMFDDVCMLAKH